MKILKLGNKIEGKGDVKGSTFIKIKESKKGYIFKVVNTITEGEYYEVLARKILDRYSATSYPSSKVFGQYAWTYMTKEKAENKFAKL